MNYFKTNKLKVTLALLTLLISFFVYLDTIAVTVSFWDCGEFIATSYTLGVPHPPGSPLFLLLGRFFSMLPTSSDIAYRVNLISPITSALAVMLLFLIIVRLLYSWGKPQNLLQKIAVYGGAFIGAMTFAFTDSHWFNAVEAEVYAIATFLTALVVWLILVWEEKADDPGHARYLLIIAYVVGLASGIHLLNLLAIFFIALVVYFKKKKVSSLGWLVLDLIIGIAFVGLLFVFFLQFKVSFSVQAVLTLVFFVVPYLFLYRRAAKARLREHAQNVLMATIASGIFLVINGGVIRGLPKIADAWGIPALVLTILVIFGVTIWSIYKRHNILSLVLMSLILVIVGYSTYTTIFIRSAQDPTIDENDPETTHQAVAYLEREQYGRRSFTDIFNRRVWKPEAANKYSGALDYFWNYQIKHMYIRYFNWQFIGRDANDHVNPFQFLLPLPFLVGIYGLLNHFSKDKQKALAVLALFLFTGLMVVLYLNQDDPQPRERDYSYVGSFLAFSIWIGIGATAIISQFAELKNRSWQKMLTYGISVVLLVVLPLNVLLANYHAHSRKGNYVAWDYSYNILQTCAPDGIVFTNGDNDTFPLWYLQEVENVRKDVRVVNLSLLNTNWYIKQLRDNEPKVPIGNLSDADIDRLTVVPWKKQKVRISAPSDSQLPPIEWELEPTFYGQGLRVQDLMIWQILESNKWQRPVYFAVTVSPENKIGLDSFLQMEGLAYRVFPEKVEPVNIKKLRTNYFEVYKYRNLNNPKVFYDDNIIKLVGNYRSGFFHLALEQLYDSDFRGVLAALDTMEARLPEAVIPIQSKDTYLQVGLLYYEASRELSMESGARPGELERRLEVLLQNPNATLKDKLRYAGIYIQQLNNSMRAVEILEDLNVKYPNNPEVLGFLIKAYEDIENYPAAIELLDEWLRVNPSDKSAVTMRDEYLRKLQQMEQKAQSDTVG